MHSPSPVSWRAGPFWGVGLQCFTSLAPRVCSGLPPGSSARLVPLKRTGFPGSWHPLAPVATGEADAATRGRVQSHHRSFGKNMPEKSTLPQPHHASRSHLCLSQKVDLDHTAGEGLHCRFNSRRPRKGRGVLKNTCSTVLHRAMPVSRFLLFGTASSSRWRAPPPVLIHTSLPRGKRPRSLLCPHVEPACPVGQNLHVRADVGHHYHAFLSKLGLLQPPRGPTDLLQRRPPLQHQVGECA